jgi:hypothetical protein
MKIILSRKGVDASAGKIASPILPGGRLLSLPIPEAPLAAAHGITYAKIDALGRSAAAVLSDLKPDLRWAERSAHLDPDLRASTLPRLAGWRPLFGQGDAAQKHLDNNGVGVGDVFLFFGWFRRTKCLGERLLFEANAPDIHLIFGYLEVGEVLRIGAGHPVPEWAKYHPHAVLNYGPSNTVYIAAPASSGGSGSRWRAGAFASFDQRLQLTGPGSSKRSRWRLPTWFYPAGRPPMTYHAAPKRWERADGHAYLNSAGRGQEFVLDMDYYPEARGWLEDILTVPTC